jgi:hypothetical protein
MTSWSAWRSPSHTCERVSWHVWSGARSDAWWANHGAVHRYSHNCNHLSELSHRNSDFFGAFRYLYMCLCLQGWSVIFLWFPGIHCIECWIIQCFSKHLQGSLKMAIAVFALMEHLEHFVQYISKSHSHRELVPFNFCYLQNKQLTNSVALVRMWTILTEWSLLVVKVSAIFCW